VDEGVKREERREKREERREKREERRESQDPTAKYEGGVPEELGTRC
jgi:hypothetical protein